jgi:hypothetical protein
MCVENMKCMYVETNGEKWKNNLALRVLQNSAILNFVFLDYLSLRIYTSQIPNDSGSICLTRSFGY